MKLAELQSLFQRAILEGGDDILKLIPNSPRENKDTLFGVYRNAYVLRLIEILQGDFAQLHTYLGDDGFEKVARAYIAAHPSRVRSARWFGAHLADFLRVTKPFDRRPVLADLAALELALNTAFDAADAPVLAMPDLASIAPDDWAHLVFTPQPCVQRIDLTTNAAAIWIATANEETPPRAVNSKTAVKVLVWRQEAMPKFRILKDEEAMMWTEAAKGVRFSVLCEMAAAFDDPDSAAMRAATYLSSWVQSGNLSSTRVAKQVRVRRNLA